MGKFPKVKYPITSSEKYEVEGNDVYDDVKAMFILSKIDSILESNKKENIGLSRKEKIEQKKIDLNKAFYYLAMVDEEVLSPNYSLIKSIAMQERAEKKRLEKMIGKCADAQKALQESKKLKEQPCIETISMKDPHKHLAVGKMPKSMAEEAACRLVYGSQAYGEKTTMDQPLNQESIDE